METPPPFARQTKIQRQGKRERACGRGSCYAKCTDCVRGIRGAGLPRGGKGAAGGTAGKPPKVACAKTFILGCFSVAEVWSSPLTLHRLYSSPQTSGVLLPTGFYVLVRGMGGGEKKPAIATSLCNFPLRSSVSLAADNTGVHARRHRRAHPRARAEMFAKAREPRAGRRCSAQGRFDVGEWSAHRVLKGRGCALLLAIYFPGYLCAVFSAFRHTV